MKQRNSLFCESLKLCSPSKIEKNRIPFSSKHPDNFSMNAVHLLCGSAFRYLLPHHYFLCMPILTRFSVRGFSLRGKPCTETNGRFIEFWVILFVLGLILQSISGFRGGCVLGVAVGPRGKWRMRKLAEEGRWRGSTSTTNKPIMLWWTCAVWSYNLI